MFTKKEENPTMWAKERPARFLFLSLKDRMFFAKYLAIMIQAGIPLDKSLLAIHNQTKSTALHHILHVVMTDVASGEFLSTSLKKFPNVFDHLFINMVEVGEQSGTLTGSLLRLAEHMEKVRDLRGKVRAAFLYPSIVIAGTLATAVYLILVLLPQLLPLFKSLNVELPWTTRTVIAISDFLSVHGLVTGLAVVSAIVALIVFAHHPKTRYATDWFVLKLPVIGPLLTQVQVAQFANVAGTMLRAGIPITEALQIASESLNNLVYRRGLTHIASSIQEGESISNYLGKHRGLFPGFVAQMISIGEDTGKLDESFLFIASFAEREVDEATKTLTIVLEPLLLLVVGGFVGFLAIAIITPIYQITRGIQG